MVSFVVSLVVSFVANVVAYFVEQCFVNFHVHFLAICAGVWQVRVADFVWQFVSLAIS